MVAHVCSVIQNAERILCAQPYMRTENLDAIMPDVLTRADYVGMYRDSSEAGIHWL